jgi:hypothetical protein
MMMIVSMARDDVSELRPTMGLLFILQVIKEHGEQWWNDINKGKFQTRPLELSLAIPPELSSSKSGGSGRRK